MAKNRPRAGGGEEGQVTPEEIQARWEQSVAQQKAGSVAMGDRPGMYDQPYWAREQAFWLSVIATQLAELLRQAQTKKEQPPPVRSVPNAGGRHFKRSEVQTPQREGAGRRYTHYFVEYVESDPPHFDKKLRKCPTQLEKQGVKVHRVYAYDWPEATKALLAHLKKERKLEYVNDDGSLVE